MLHDFLSVTFSTCQASPTSPTSPQSTNAAGTLRSTPMTYPRLVTWQRGELVSPGQTLNALWELVVSLSLDMFLWCMKLYENLDMNEILLYSIHVSYMSYDMMTDKHMMCSKIDYDGMPWHLGFPISRRRCVTSPRPWVGAMWSRPVRCGWPRCGQCWTVGWGGETQLHLLRLFHPFSAVFHRFRLGRTVRSCAPLRTNAESRDAWSQERNHSKKKETSKELVERLNGSWKFSGEGKLNTRSNPCPFKVWTTASLGGTHILWTYSIRCVCALWLLELFFEIHNWDVFAPFISKAISMLQWEEIVWRWLLGRCWRFMTSQFTQASNGWCVIWNV